MSSHRSDRDSVNQVQFRVFIHNRWGVSCRNVHSLRRRHEISAGPTVLQKLQQVECDRKVSLHSREVRFAVCDVIKRSEKRR